MASGGVPLRAGETAPPTEISRVRQLLSQAVEALGGTYDRSPTPSSATTTPSVTGSAVSAAATNRAFVSSALSERNLLFNFDRKRNYRGSSSKGGKSKKSRISFWSHYLVCLADNDQVKTASSFKRSQLLAAGMIKWVELIWGGVQF